MNGKETAQKLVDQLGQHVHAIEHIELELSEPIWKPTEATDVYRMLSELDELRNHIETVAADAHTLLRKVGVADE